MDPYVILAAKTFGKHPSNVTKDERRAAKVAFFRECNVWDHIVRTWEVC